MNRFARFFILLGGVLFLFPVQLAFGASLTDQNISVTEDRSVSTTYRVTGTSGRESCTLNIYTAPQHGSATVSGSRVTYAPTANYNGTDSYQVQGTCSRSGLTNVATGNVTISAVNDVPQANDPGSVTLVENTTGTVLLSGTDVDGTPLSCYAQSGMAVTFTIPDPTSCIGTLTPAANFNGTAYATFRVFDGTAYSPSLQFSVTVTALDTPPVAQNISRDLNEDSTVSLTLQATDADSSSLSYRSVTDPMNGALSISGNTATYTPFENYNGSDSFTYVANDGNSDSNTATVSLTLNATNDVPVANAVSTSTDVRTPVTIILNGTDVDGDVLTYSVVSDPIAGTVSDIFNVNQVTYTPMEGTEGSFSFNYSVSDATRTSSGTVTVTLVFIPVAATMGVVTLENNSVDLTLEGQSESDAALSFTVVDSPRHGSLTGTGNLYTYTPTTDYVGPDEFTYTVSDGTRVSDLATVYLSVTPSTGVSGLDIVEAGINFVTFSEEGGAARVESFLTILDDLGAQAIRQVGEADWYRSFFETDNEELSTLVRQEMMARGIQVFSGLFSLQYSSCTPGTVELNETNFVGTVDASCYEYLDAVIAHARTLYGDEGEGLMLEPFNEMFHWIAYGDLFPYDQQAFFIEEVNGYLKAALPESTLVCSSVMFADTGTGAWLTGILAAVGEDYNCDIQTNHYYSVPTHFLADLETYNASRRMDRLQMMTEFGISVESEDTSPEYEAAFVAKLFPMQWAHGFYAVFFHALGGLEPGEGAGDDTQGLFLSLIDEGEYNLAAYTYRLVTSELVPYVQVSDFSESDQSVMHYVVRLSNGDVKHIYWGTDAITVPEGITQWTSMISDVDGTFTWQSIVPGQTFVLSDTPLLMK